MDSFLPCLATLAAKSISKLIRLSGAGMASNLPGKIANAICPNTLPYFAKQLTRGCLAVSGTNGKSTTSGLLASILAQAGYQVIHNRQGANLIAGITAAFTEAANLNGSLKGNFGLLEVDEAALPLLTKTVDCQNILVTNLYRDQLDRYGELDKTAKLIAQGIAQKQSNAILNADDPNVCNLSCPATKIFYGLNNSSLNYDTTSPVSTVNDLSNTEISYCPHCGNEIYYGSSKTLSGNWSCLSCNYKRPDLDFYASNIKLFSEHSTFVLNDKHGSASITLPLPGLFNVYNATAAGAAASHLGVNLNTIKTGLEKYETLFGRSEKVHINDRLVVIQLIKNPAGASKSLASLTNSKCAKVVIAINDNLADGRDISWLWDANFEALANIDTSFIVSGQRAQDMAVRLKYAGIKSTQIVCIPSISLALKEALEETPVKSTLWLLPTYTALLEIQRILKQYKD